MLLSGIMYGIQPKLDGAQLRRRHTFLFVSSNKDKCLYIQYCLWKATLELSTEVDLWQKKRRKLRPPISPM